MANSILEVAISGDQALLNAMKEIREDMVDKIAPAGIRGYLQVVAKGIKAELPSKMKDARKSIGWGFKKFNKRTGEVHAKVGVKAGMKKAKQEQLANEAASKRRAAGKNPGSKGISVKNMMWWIEGTDPRSTKLGHNRGKMKTKHPIVRDGHSKSRHAALAKFQENVKKDMKKRVAKQRKKARGRISKSVIRSTKSGIAGLLK